MASINSVITPRENGPLLGYESPSTKKTVDESVVSKTTALGEERLLLSPPFHNRSRGLAERIWTCLQTVGRSIFCCMTALFNQVFCRNAPGNIELVVVKQKEAAGADAAQEKQFPSQEEYQVLIAQLQANIAQFQMTIKELHKLEFKDPNDLIVLMGVNAAMTEAVDRSVAVKISRKGLDGSSSETLKEVEDLKRCQADFSKLVMDKQAPLIKLVEVTEKALNEAIKEDKKNTMTLYKGRVFLQCLEFLKNFECFDKVRVGFGSQVRENITRWMNQFEGQLSGRRRFARDPGGLHNIGNSCYINAGIQTLLIRELLPALLERARNAEHQPAPAVKNVISALHNLLEALAHENEDDIISALYGFRFILFESRLNDDFSFERGIGYCRQHDGAVFLNLILDLLDCSFESYVVRKVPVDGVETPFQSANERLVMLGLTIPADGKQRSLQELFDLYFAENKVNDPRNAYVRSGVSYSKYTSQLRLAGEPPEFLPIQLVRMLDEASDLSRNQVVKESFQQLEKEYGSSIRSELMREGISDRALLNEMMGARINELVNEELGIANGTRKLSAPIHCPNGVINATSAFNSATPVHYRIVSFEMHHGTSPNVGHYTSYRYENGQWFHFDDHKKSAVSNDQAHLAMASAYNLICQKIRV